MVFAVAGGVAHNGAISSLTFINMMIVMLVLMIIMMMAMMRIIIILPSELQR